MPIYFLSEILFLSSQLQGFCSGVQDISLKHAWLFSVCIYNFQRYKVMTAGQFHPLLLRGCHIFPGPPTLPLFTSLERELILHSTGAEMEEGNVNRRSSTKSKQKKSLLLIRFCSPNQLVLFWSLHLGRTAWDKRFLCLGFFSREDTGVIPSLVPRVSFPKRWVETIKTKKDKKKKRKKKR